MRYFTLLDFQHWVLALGLGLLAVIFVYIAWRSYPSPEEGELEPGREHAGHSPGPHPFPPILIFIYVGAMLWALGYALVEGVWGNGI